MGALREERRALILINGALDGAEGERSEGEVWRLDDLVPNATRADSVKRPEGETGLATGPRAEAHPATMGRTTPLWAVRLGRSRWSVVLEE